MPQNALTHTFFSTQLINVVSFSAQSTLSLLISSTRHPRKAYPCRGHYLCISEYAAQVCRCPYCLDSTIPPTPTPLSVITAPWNYNVQTPNPLKSTINYMLSLHQGSMNTINMQITELCSSNTEPWRLTAPPYLSICGHNPKIVLHTT